MKTVVAQYILSLKTAQDKTHRAEDRAVYQSYLADAAVILALVETDANQSQVDKAIAQHERLWGNAWLADDVYKDPSSKWALVKKCAA